MTFNETSLNIGRFRLHIFIYTLVVMCTMFGSLILVQMHTSHLKWNEIKATKHKASSQLKNAIKSTKYKTNYISSQVKCNKSTKYKANHISSQMK